MTASKLVYRWARVLAWDFTRHSKIGLVAVDRVSSVSGLMDSSIITPGLCSLGSWGGMLLAWAGVG